MSRTVRMKTLQALAAITASVAVLASAPLQAADTPEAEQKLARLAQLCSSPCEALDDLAKAIERFKANGNR